MPEGNWLLLRGFVHVLQYGPLLRTRTVRLPCSQLGSTTTSHSHTLTLQTLVEVSHFDWCVHTALRAHTPVTPPAPGAGGDVSRTIERDTGTARYTQLLSVALGCTVEGLLRVVSFSDQYVNGYSLTPLRQKVGHIALQAQMRPSACSRPSGSPRI